MENILLALTEFMVMFLFLHSYNLYCYFWKNKLTCNLRIFFYIEVVPIIMLMAQYHLEQTISCFNLCDLSGSIIFVFKNRKRCIYL